MSQVGRCGQPRVFTLLLLLLPHPAPALPRWVYSMAAETGAREKVDWFTIEAMVGSLMPLLLYRHSEGVACRSFNMY